MRANGLGNVVVQGSINTVLICAGASRAASTEVPGGEGGQERRNLQSLQCTYAGATGVGSRGESLVLRSCVEKMSNLCGKQVGHNWAR